MCCNSFLVVFYITTHVLTYYTHTHLTSPAALLENSADGVEVLADLRAAGQ